MYIPSTYLVPNKVGIQDYWVNFYELIPSQGPENRLFPSYAYFVQFINYFYRLTS